MACRARGNTYDVKRVESGLRQQGQRVCEPYRFFLTSIPPGARCARRIAYDDFNYGDKERT
jgi:hypothetical protein